MSRTRIVGGKIIKTTGGNHSMYSKGNIVFTAGGTITETGVENGIVFGTPQKPPKIKITDLKVTKVEGPFDENMKLVKDVKIGESYMYKATPSRKPNDFELKLLKWAIKNDDKKSDKLSGVAFMNQLASDGTIILNIRINKDCEKAKVYAYFNYVSKNTSVTCYISSIKLKVTDKIIGYSIMRLFDVQDDFKTTMIKNKFACAIVSVYKVLIIESRNGIEKTQGSFGVTRDAWQKIGEVGKNYHLLNRAFEPKNENENVYKAKHSFVPSQYGGLVKIDAFELTLDGSSKIPAEPILRNTKLDGTPINHPRIKLDEANAVNIHIGGHYTRGKTMKTPVTVEYSSPTTMSSSSGSYEISEIGIHWVGGSLGCFSFIEPEDIKSTIELATDFHNKGRYAKNTSNREWQNVINKIHKLETKEKLPLKIEIVKRTNMKKEIENFNPKHILWE
ncbi:hypothetical protein ABF176_002517 [Flavobacterium psychrophilum]